MSYYYSGWGILFAPFYWIFRGLFYILFQNKYTSAVISLTILGISIYCFSMSAEDRGYPGEISEAMTFALITLGIGLLSLGVSIWRWVSYFKKGKKPNKPVETAPTPKN